MTPTAGSDLVRDESPASALNENHVRRIQATFWYVDDLLRSVEALTHEDPSPFARERPDAEQVAGVAGPAGEVLRQLLAVCTARGLTEMRPLIAAAAERAAATTLDVGVFGRVSSGKSSLINALVGEAVLPVGATPVTAVPLRIGRGPHWVEVRFYCAVLSKADLLDPADRERTRAYIAAAVDLEKRRGAAAVAIGKTTEALANSAKRVLAAAAEALAASWARGDDGAPVVRSAIVSAASRGLSAVREVVDRVRSQAGDAEEAGARRLPPLFDPEFLEAIKTLPPPPLAPGFLRRSRARSTLAQLLPFLDQALTRYAGRLEAWGQGALRELRPAGQPTSAADARSPELAGLETLIAEVGAAVRADGRVREETLGTPAGHER